MAEKQSTGGRQAAQGGAIPVEKKFREDGSPDFMAMAEAMKQKRSGAQEVQRLLPIEDMEVPRTPNGTSPMNNHLARTNLFSPIRAGKRAMLDRVRLAGPAGVEVFFSGKRLDMADQDVFLHALQLAAGMGENQKVVINRHAFLDAIGRKGRGQANYQWLRDAFFRLAQGRIEINTQKYEASYPLMGSLLHDKEKGEYYFTIPCDTLSLFLGKEYGYVSIERRNMLEKGVDLAKWIQSYASSHKKGEHRISVQNLHTWSGFTGRIRDFKREYLPRALSELVRVGEFKDWLWGDEEKDVVIWYRF